MPRRPGPTPRTADVIELRGNPGKLTKAQIEERREKEVHAEPVRDLDPPRHLSTWARECWHLHAPELERLGLLSRLDVGAFEMTCEAYAMARSALEAMRPKKADGTPDGRRRDYEVISADKVHGGIKRHPAFPVFNSAANTYRSWCVEFGLTPSARVTLRPGAMRSSESGADDGADDFDFGT